MKKFLILLIGTVFSFVAVAQTKESDYVKKHFNKEEVYIPMRDGVKLFTAIYTPKEEGEYPIMMQRTCYSIAPYGEDQFKSQLGPSKHLMKEGYIFVYQDVRGRWMSEGDFTNMTPNIPGNKHKKQTDESSDTYDTIEWLLKHLKKKTNGRVGQWGISYPGFYTAAALPDAHPALKASSPQAPIGDFFFDDFHHNGAYLQSYTAAYPVFGYQTEPTTESWYMEQIRRMRKPSAVDGYDYHLEMGPLKNITEEIHYDNEFWQQTIEHPNYDEFWQKRSIIPHMKDVDHAIMTVGGWFDAEDLYGPLNIYKSNEKNSPDAYNIIVMGPWSHGDWARERGFQTVNHIYYGDSMSTFYQKEIEMEFFNHFLKGSVEGQPDLPEAYMYDTGLKEWQKFDVWPPQIPQVTLGFAENGKLLINEEGEKDESFDYVSDPAKPVPYTSFTEPVTFTPRAYMTDDQRHASRRPDVLTFTSDELQEDFVLAGEIMAKLKVAISSTDADFIVKVIDVYPPDHENYEHNPENIVMGNYQQLVRAEVFRGRFRNSFAEPEPFTPNEVTEVEYRLQDILHTFKKDHKVMIQIHSTWFPYIDRNPQKYVDNIYEAEEEDFVKATISVKGNSVIEIGDLKTVPQSLTVEKD